MSKTSLFFAFLLMFFNLKSWSQEGSNVKISDVVAFEVEKSDLKSNKFQIILHTKDDFKVYEHNLQFEYAALNGFPYELKYAPTPRAVQYFDPFYKEQKQVFKNGTLFAFKPETTLGSEDNLKIKLQACSKSMCLLPSELILNLKEGMSSSEIRLDPVVKPRGDTMQSNVVALSSRDLIAGSSSTTIGLNNSLADQIQNALLSKSFLLFPALFLAGLLMNLTPCVYPMIPITLSVMSHFGADANLSDMEKRRRRRIFPLIYVAGMVLTYSLLGVVAGMTGSLFGSQFSNPIFSIVMACVMFLLGFAMLGVLQLSFVQTFANKIPLVKSNPVLSVATMGAVSGLVSAPCTGPVLSMVLLLIAQNKDPISGFVFMIFFSCGFGLPYVLLGFFSQNLTRLPKFPRVVFFTKIVFASLMFGLGIYFLKGMLEQIPFLNELITKPSEALFVSTLLLTILCAFFASKKIAYIGAILSLTLLSTWMTFWISNSFFSNKEFSYDTKRDPLAVSKIQWQTDFQKAIALAKEKNKPLFVDIWAQWCAACLEMDQTTWRNLEVARVLNENYIPLKLDYTDAPKETQELLDRWNVVGLPGVLIFQAGSDLSGKPQTQFQGKISDDVLLNSLH